MKERESTSFTNITSENIRAPELKHIKETIVVKGEEYSQDVTKIIGITKPTLCHFIKKTSCSYDTFVKLVAYCEEIAPDEDWYYTPREELLKIMKEFRKAGGRMGKASGIPKSTLKNCSVGFRLPNLTTYYKLITYLGGKLNVPNNFSSN